MEEGHRWIWLGSGRSSSLTVRLPPCNIEVGDVEGGIEMRLMGGACNDPKEGASNRNAHERKGSIVFGEWYDSTYQENFIVLEPLCSRLS